MIKQLMEPFKLNMKYVSGLHFITLNEVTTVLNDDELEKLEFSLTDLNHAITMYKIANKLEEYHVG